MITKHQAQRYLAARKRGHARRVIGTPARRKHGTPNRRRLFTRDGWPVSELGGLGHDPCGGFKRFDPITQCCVPRIPREKRNVPRIPREMPPAHHPQPEVPLEDPYGQMTPGAFGRWQRHVVLPRQRAHAAMRKAGRSVFKGLRGLGLSFDPLATAGGAAQSAIDQAAANAPNQYIPLFQSIVAATGQIGSSAITAFTRQARQSGASTQEIAAAIAAVRAGTGQAQPQSNTGLLLGAGAIALVGILALGGRRR